MRLRGAGVGKLPGPSVGFLPYVRGLCDTAFTEQQGGARDEPGMGARLVAQGFAGEHANPPAARCGGVAAKKSVGEDQLRVPVFGGLKRRPAAKALSLEQGAAGFRQLTAIEVVCVGAQMHVELVRSAGDGAGCALRGGDVVVA